MKQLDVARSFVRSAALVVQNRWANTRMRRLFERVLSPEVSLSESTLSKSLAHAPNIKEVSVSAVTGAVCVEAKTDEGESVVVRLVPAGAHFAPRGAKEVLFRVEPADLAGHRAVSVLVAALAVAIAKELCGLVLRFSHQDEDVKLAVVDREGAFVRVDLRTARCIARASRHPIYGLLLDVISVRRFAVVDNALRLQFGVGP